MIGPALVGQRADLSVGVWFQIGCSVLPLLLLFVRRLRRAPSLAGPATLAAAVTSRIVLDK